MFFLVVGTLKTMFSVFIFNCMDAAAMWLCVLSDFYVLIFIFGPQERGFAVESGTVPDTEFLNMPVAILVGMTKSSSKLWTCQPSLPLTKLYVSMVGEGHILLLLP